MIVRGLLLHFAFIFQVLFPSCKAVCSNHNDCQYFSWQTWSVCYGGNPCSDSVKMRKRLFCCPNVVLKQTIERCLKHCNVTDPSEELISIGPYCQNTSLSLQHICKDVVRCSDNPCKHGTCKDTTSSFVCTCDPGYEGVDCDTRKACSGGISCQHGGSCRDTGSPGFQCHCTRKYNGEFCENALTCHDAPCLNGGICTDVGSSFQCKCPYTHTGDVCEAALSCSDTPCQNLGTCSGPLGNFRCNCPPTYKGDICDTVITCASQPCQHGTCTDSPTGFKCACESSYTGVQCDTDIDQANELLLPEWFPYLEYTLLSMVSLVGVMAMGCFFLKCCQAFGVIGKKDDDDEDHENQYEDYKRYKRDSIVPLDHRKPPSFKIHTGLEF
ncbi:uncharacterized protein LOC111134166 isoform X3 [Crassostrea virginica]